MPSLFRRKSTDLVADATSTVSTEPEPSAAAKSKAYTPSKKELGVATPKRTNAQRRHDTAQAPANRREAYKQMRERQKVERAEASAGMRAGDERYLLARDRGPERALVRNIVDAKRTAGTWFFAGAIIVFIGSTGAMPPVVQIGANLLWAILAIAVLVDSVLIARKVKTMVKQRYPDTGQRMGSLQLYAIMRGITFRRMRVPKPMVEIGQKL